VTGPALTQTAAEERLDDVKSMLAADGYELTIAVRPDDLVLGIVATATACEECLVPKDLMTDIVRDSLGGDGAPYDGPMTLRYPAEVGGAAS
jgi:hypothetical protein